MNWVKTSRGPVQVEHITRTSEYVDNGKVKGITFHTTDGGALTLPLAEGDWLRQWINERAVFDSRTMPGDRMSFSTNAAAWEYARGSGGE